MLNEDAQSKLIYGALTLIPLGAAVVVLFKLIEGLDQLTRRLGLEHKYGTLLAVLVGIVGLVALTYAVGAIVRTQVGLYLHGNFERQVLSRVPGYAILSRVLKSRIEDNDDYKPALVQLFGEGTQVLGFVMERNANGTVTVYVPSSPAFSVGTLHIVDPARVTLLDARYRDVINCIADWGIGSDRLLRSAAS